MTPSSQTPQPAAQHLPGHPFFAYQNGQLCAEDVPLARLAQAHQTPLFVYSKAAMLEALKAYQRGFAGRRALICYAMKANSTLAVLQLFAQQGCGFDIVSGGELARALKAGADPKKIIFSGVGKTPAEMRAALQAGILCFNVESRAELAVLNDVALSMQQIAPISLRVNPNVDAKTHPYISTGLKGNKFGVAHEEALATYQYAASLKGLRIMGIDCHIGSQILELAPYLEAMDRVLDLVQSIEAAGITLQHIDFGGGLGIDYEGQQPPAADVLWQQLLAKIDARGLSDKGIIIEPGRSLVGNAGVCLTQVLYLKTAAQNAEAGDSATNAKNFCIVDAAMNDLPRAAMYQAFHGIVPCKAHGISLAGGGVEEKIYDVVGPVCESGDWLGKDRALSVSAGDCLAVLSAGAYCMSMASNYNTRSRAAEVLVDGDRAMLIRARESLEDQMRHEVLLAPKLLAPEVL